MSYVAADSGDNIRMVDERDGNMTIAILRFTREAGISFQWMSCLFDGKSFPDLVPMPDSVREAIVMTLRHHANKLESKEMDARMAELLKEQA